MDTIPPASGIYKITCTANNRIYIGSAVNLQHRKNCHFYDLRQNRHHSLHLQRAWNKYGSDAFTFEVLELVLPMSLTAREQYWLNELKPFGRKGFNIAHDAGSPLGLKRSPEAREKVRQSNLGRKASPETRAKMRYSQRVRIRSRYTPEAKARMSQSALARGYSPKAIESMRQANLGTKRTPETLENMRQAQLRRNKEKKE